MGKLTFTVARFALVSCTAIFLTMSFAKVSVATAVAGELTAWTPKVRALVERVIQDNAETAPRVAAKAPGKGMPGQRPVVVFDFDNTMIKGDIAYGVLLYQAVHDRFAFDPSKSPEIMSPEVASLFGDASVDADGVKGLKGEALLRQRQYALFDRYRGINEEKGKTGALLYLVHLLSGFTVEEVHELTLSSFKWFQTVPTCERRFAPEGRPGEPVTKAYGVRLREPIRAMVKKFREADFEIWVVSASPKWVVDVGASFYGIPADHVLGTRTRLDERGRLTTEADPPVTYRQGKVDAIKANIGRRPVIIFGDSWTDLEMLRYAQNGVLLDKGDKALLEELSKTKTVLVQERFADESPWTPCPPSP